MPFHRETKISSKQAEQLVLDLANHSDWQYVPGSSKPFRHFASIAELEHYCRTEMDNEDEEYEDINLAKVVERARTWAQSVYYFENDFEGHSWQASGSAQGSVSVPDPKTGGWATLTGNGLLISSEYQSQFYHARQEIEECINNVSYVTLGHAMSAGITSVETYIRYRSYCWNLANPSAQLTDTKSHPISMDEKIDRWIPLMSGGHKIDKSGRLWQDFLVIKRSRDNAAIHPKDMSYSVNYAPFGYLVNKFPNGIARMLFEMHKLFGDITPAKIIKLCYAPKVRWVPETEED